MIFPKRVTDLPIEIRRGFEFSSDSVSPITGVSVVIPVRGIDRQNNLNFCISRMLMQNVHPLEIIVSEEDAYERIKVDYFARDSRVRKVFTRSQKPFNKSIAINVGVCLATNSKIVMNDADIIPPKGYIARIDETLEVYDSCFFAKEIYNVNLCRSGIVWSGGKRTDYFSGGSIAFTKKAFFDIGGMCEEFYGYGSEDCEFWGRIRNLTNMYECRDTAVLHIAHKRPEQYSVNSELYDKIMKKDMAERLAALKSDLSKRHFN
jgi:glycosyltransferase involved in cell wall biosynthesis